LNSTPNAPSSKAPSWHWPWEAKALHHLAHLQHARHMARAGFKAFIANC